MSLMKAKKTVLNNYRFERKQSKYHCNECEYSTEVRGYVRQHMVCHSSDRPFVCDYVNFDITYKRSNELKRHIKVFHLGEKAYECHVCHKQFTQSNSWKEHIQVIHQKLKPHVCGINGCNKSFGYLNSFKIHQFRRHDIKNNKSLHNQINDKFNKYKTRANSHQNNSLNNCSQSSLKINNLKVRKNELKSQVNNNSIKSLKTKRKYNKKNKKDSSQENSLTPSLNDETIGDENNNCEQLDENICEEIDYEIQSPRNGRTLYKRDVKDYGLKPLKTKRKYNNKNKTDISDNNTNSHLFECNFFDCNYNTYIWEEIAEHFVVHWNETKIFDENEESMQS